MSSGILTKLYIQKARDVIELRLLQAGGEASSFVKHQVELTIKLRKGIFGINETIGS